jgi:hypothetical protein
MGGVGKENGSGDASGSGEMWEPGVDLSFPLEFLRALLETGNYKQALKYRQIPLTE